MAIARSRDALSPKPSKSRAPRGGRVKATTTVDELAPNEAVLREFIADFSAAGSLMRALRARLANALDLSAAEHSVMLGLWYCERRGTTSVRELAHHLHVAAAHVTAELGKLGALGLIEKKPSASDKRAIEVRLTRKGNELLDRLAPMLRDVNSYLFANVSYRDMQITHRFLRQIIEQAPEAIQVAELGAPLRQRR